MTALSADAVEYIHDVLVVSFLPFNEQVRPDEYRDRALIESAVGRPFQTAFGVEVWPELPQKAAALFHSLTCNHCFTNGNKRTAVLALDLFLALNGYYMALTSEDVYRLAKHTASANESDRNTDGLLADLTTTIRFAAIDPARLDVADSQIAALGNHMTERIAALQSSISCLPLPYSNRGRC